jgi:hypothetical protein
LRRTRNYEQGNKNRQSKSLGHKSCRGEKVAPDPVTKSLLVPTTLLGSRC